MARRRFAQPTQGADAAQRQALREEWRQQRRELEERRLQTDAGATDYGAVSLSSPAVRAAADYDHAKGIRHPGLPCCAPGVTP
jgi:3-oxoacyl-[acyl-carrier-protein] synthase III